jgi:hypothetical protein
MITPDELIDTKFIAIVGHRPHFRSPEPTFSSYEIILLMSCPWKHHRWVIKEERNEIVEMSKRLHAA